MDWGKYITIDQTICNGEPCIRGTRIMVRVLLDNIAAGVSVDELLASYPSLTRDDVHAAMRYSGDA